MSEQNIVHASDFGNYTDNVVSTIKIGDVDVDVRYTIPVADALKFSDSVINLCYTNSNSVYTPEVKDFAIRVNTIMRYTNIELPESTEDKYMFLYATDVFDIVRKEINPKQFRSIIYGIDEKIEYINNTIMNSVYREFTSIVNDMEKLGMIIKETIGTVDNEAINAMASAISNGQFDENKFASEIFKLIHKGNETN